MVMFWCCYCVVSLIISWVVVLVVVYGLVLRVRLVSLWYSGLCCVVRFCSICLWFGCCSSGLFLLWVKCFSCVVMLICR